MTKPFMDGINRPLDRRIQGRLTRLKWWFRNLLPPTQTKRDSIQFVFAISTGRTGTQYLARFFDTHSTNVRGYHEPYPDLIVLGAEYAYGRVSFDEAVRQVRIARNWYLRHLDRPIFLETNLRLFALPQVLRVTFPGSKIIHVIRDGRKVVRSALARKWYSPDDDVPRLTPNHFRDDPYASEWDAMSPVSKNAWLWQKSNRIMREAIAGLDNTMLVRFEHLFDSDSDTTELQRVIDFIGAEVPLGHEELERARKHRVNITKAPMQGYSDWSPEDRETFARIAGEEMRHYHYDF